MSVKSERLAQTILKELSRTIQNDLKDNKVGFITITDVKVTNDLSIATIYVNFLGSEDRNEAGMKALEHSKGFLRSELAKKLTMRKVPELKFEIDKSLENGNRINDILKKINKEQ